MSLIASTLCAQDASDAPAAQPQELHWAIKLGLRSYQVTQAFPLVDRVVLVPDAATYLDELAKWSPRGRWPVLFDEPIFAPMFIRRFGPAEVLRRESVGPMPEKKRDRESQIERTVVASWGGDPTKQTIEQTFAANKFTPMGVVVTSVDDPAWTAGVALAAGHGQPIFFNDAYLGKDRGVLGATALSQLTTPLETDLAALPYSHLALGDDIDAITICRDIAALAHITLRGGTQADYLASTDLIGRDENETRWAFAGWIFGDESRAAYVAMSSLFLDRTNALLVNTYPEEGQWGTYGLAKVAPALQSLGFKVEMHEGPGASADAWQRLLPGGITTDFVMFNTKGMRDFFDMSSGRSFALDVPMLNTPVAVHFIHSFSMFNPSDTTTVAGRWIKHGAYAYVGSVAEPSLGGFIPPMMVTERLVNFVPFLVAARYWDGARAAPWKIATYGDPLMLITRPEKAAHPRITMERTDGVNLLDHTRQLMTQLNDKPTAPLYQEVMADLVMLGKDDIAAELWRHAQQDGFAEAAADSALGVLFRRRNSAEFMQAWEAMPTRTDADIDMLWQLLTPRLEGADKDTLLQLQSAIRPGQPEVDLGRLLPDLERAFGAAHCQMVIDRELDKATDDPTRKKLEKLRRR